jgi:ribosome-associated translation inhibitor RaiA
VFHILDHIRTKNVSEQLEKFQSLISNLISLRIDINLGEEADKLVCDFTASIASAHRLAWSKINLSELNNDLYSLDQLLKYKKRMRKLWQDTRDLECNMAVNWASKAIRHMT